MFTIGTQLSSGKGFEHLGTEALSIGANTFQFFMRNPRGIKARALDADDLLKLKKLMADNRFGPVIAHSPYTLNACSKDPHLFAIRLLNIWLEVGKPCKRRMDFLLSFPASL